MAEAKIERTAKQEEEGKIVISSVVTENLDKAEFATVITNYNTKIINTENAIEDAKKGLMKLKDVEETEELKKFNEMLNLSNRLTEKSKAIETIKQQEAALMKLREESKGLFEFVSQSNTSKK